MFQPEPGEFGATITFVGNIPEKPRTIPIAIYSLLQQPDGESMAMRMGHFISDYGFFSLDCKLLDHAEVST